MCSRGDLERDDRAQFSQVDLGYAPPFSPVWDPVLVAARQIVNQVDRSKSEPWLTFGSCSGTSATPRRRALPLGVSPRRARVDDCYRTIVAGEFGARWNAGAATSDELAMEMAPRLGC